jgi:hypothetical protein
LFLEDFAPKFVFIPGASNVITDGLSRAPIWEGQGDFLIGDFCVFLPPPKPTQGPIWEGRGDSLIGDFCVFLPPPESTQSTFPLDFELMAIRQAQDQHLQNLRNQLENFDDVVDGFDCDARGWTTVVTVSKKSKKALQEVNEELT